MVFLSLSYAQAAVLDKAAKLRQQREAERREREKIRIEKEQERLTQV